jgi:hypothetical protein
MAKLACSVFDGNCRGCSFNFYPPCPPKASAERLYAAGYRKQSGWISVDEEPTENGTYLCYGYWIGSRTYQMETADYIGEWDIVNNFVLTHWMPLPEPPKGE